MATYVNDLRLKEIATGDESGTWGTSTNTNLELIGEALGYGTQDCFSSDADATTTVADGATDPARSMYFKVTSSATLTATRTLTIAPNTISRVMFIENATTGSQSINISQGSGANVTIATGKTAVVYLDGAGSGAAVVDAMALVDPGVTDTLAEVLTAGNTSSGTNIELTTTDKVQFRDAAIYINSSVDGQLDIVADTEVQIAATTIDVNGTLAFDSLKGTGATTVTNILDEDNMASDSATALATQQSIKAYVDSQVASFDTLAEVLAQGNTTGGTDILITSGDAIGAPDASGTDIAGTAVTVKGGAGTGTGAGGSLVFQTAPAGTTGSTPNAQVTALTIDSAGDATFTGASYNMSWDKSANSLTFADNARAVFGAGSDLEILSNGTDGLIRNGNATGEIRMESDDRIIFADRGFNEVFAVFNDDDDVKLYHDGNQKLATTSTGIDVTGTAVTDGVTVDGVLGFVANASFPTTGLVLYTNNYLYQRGGSSGIIFADASGTNEIARFTPATVTFNEDSNDQDFRVESNNNANMLFVDAGNDYVGIGKTPSYTLDVNGVTRIGSVSSVSGAKNIGLYYTVGNIGTIGGYYGSGGPVLGYGVWPKNGSAGFVSSSSLTGLERQAVHLSGNQMELWSGAGQTVAEDSDVTITKHAVLSGQTGYVFNEAGADINFRVESSTGTHALFVDAGNDRVGVGASSPQTKLHIASGINDTPTTLRIENLDTAIETDQEVNTIEFYTNDASASGTGVSGKIAQIAANPGNQYDLAFFTYNTSLDEAMRLTENGNMGVGEPSPDARLHVKTSSSGDTVIIESVSDTALHGPNIVLHRNSGSPADDDMLGRINFNADDSAGSEITYAQVLSQAKDVTAGTADARLKLGGLQAGTFVNYLDNQPTESVFNEDSVDRDFRVESDSETHALFVDAGTSRVGINKSAPNRALDVHSGTASDITTFANDAGGYTFGYTANLASWDLGASDSLRVRHGSTETVRIKTTESVFNELSADIDFRVESNSRTHTIFVDAGEDVVKLGWGNATVPTYVGAGSVMVTDNIYGYQGGDTANSLYNISVDDNYVYYIHNGYYGGSGWTQRNAGFAPTMYRQGSGSHQFEVANDAGSDDTGITWRPILKFSESGGFVWNENSYDTDFRVESDNSSHMFFLDASTDRIGIGSSAPTDPFTIGSAFLSSGVAGTQFTVYALDNDSTLKIGQDANNSSLLTMTNSTATQTIQAVGHNGNLTISGALSKGSGSFKIDHPLPAKRDTHHLVHSFVEAPQADNIYRGKVDLVAGSASVNIDTVAGMTDGTFVLLNREVQCFTSNETGWTPVKGSVSGNTLTITAQDNTCTDTISWLVIGERQDQHMFDTEWTDSNGKVIVEPLKGE